jgi:hypothetical protein
MTRNLWVFTAVTALAAVAAIAAEKVSATGATASAPAESNAAPPASNETAAETKALLEGQLPDAPARALVQAKCLLCHTSEYVTMQRLTEKQWQATVEKMRRFGSPASDEEVKAMVGYLARYWTPGLPPLRPVLVPPPPGALPRK